MIKKNKEFNDWYVDAYNKGLQSHIFENNPFSMQVGIYLQFIREERGVVIYAYTNASGYLWAMHMEDGGTDLGWSNFTGDCNLSKTFTSYDKAIADAINLELEFGCLKILQTDKTPVGHWMNYAKFLQNKRNNHGK